MTRSDPSGISRAKPAPTIGELTPTDAALGLISSIASAVPLIGGPAASVVTEIRRTFDRRQAARLAAVVNDLGHELRRLADRIERDIGKDGEFAAFLEAAIQSAAEARNADKRRYYVALMARSATTEGPEQAQRGLLLDTLDRLHLTHLTLLHAVAVRPMPAKFADYRVEGTAVYAALRTALPDLHQMFLQRAWEDMVGLGLIHSSGNYLISQDSPVDADGSPITPFGRAFLDFISPFPHETEHQGGIPGH